MSLAVALAGGVVMAAVAGAGQTRTALPRFVEEYRAEDFLAYLDGSLAEQSELPDRLEELPGVAAATGSAFLVFASTDDEGRAVPGFDAIIGAAGFVDDHAMRTITRQRVLEGRLASPAAADEVVVNQAFADNWAVGVGDILSVVAYAPDQRQTFVTGGRVDPSGPRFDLRVVGIVLDPGDVAIQSLPELDSRHIGLSPAFWAAHRDDVANYGVEVSARLEPGADADAVEQAAIDQIDGITIERQNASLPTIDATQRAIELQADALLATAIVFAVVAAGLIALSTTRRVSAADGEDTVLAALGWGRRELALSAVARSLPVAVVGAVGAAGFAVALSPRFPFGTARQAEVDPGVRIDAVVLSGGVLLIAGYVLVVAAVAGRRSLVGGADQRSRPRRNPLSDRLARGGAPTTVVVAVALPLHGPRRGTTLSALIASVAAVTTISAALVLGPGTARLVDQPALWGQTWDVIAGLYDTGQHSPADAAALRANPAVSAFSATSSLAVSPDTMAIDGRVTGVVGIDPLEGELLPLLLEGTQPDAPGEVALGRLTLAALDREVGDEVELSVPDGGSRRAVITGAVVVPASLAPDARLGDGATMTLEAVDELRPGNATPAGYLVRFADGVSHDDGVAALGPTFGGTVAPPGSAADIVSVDRVRGLPWILAALVAALALATVLHALITGNRHQRHDLGVLRALGFNRHQIRSIGAIQATTFSLLAAVLGLPFGIAIGTQVWARVMAGLGLEVPVDLPTAALLLAVPATIAAGLLLAALPIRAAARTNPAAALRAD